MMREMREEERKGRLDGWPLVLTSSFLLSKELLCIRLGARSRLGCSFVRIRSLSYPMNPPNPTMFNSTHLIPNSLFVTFIWMCLFQTEDRIGRHS